MPRPLTSAQILAKNQIGSGMPVCVLLEIKTAGALATIRICNNNQIVSYGGYDFVPVPFSMQPTRTDLEGRLPELEIQISNAGRTIAYGIEAQGGDVAWDVAVICGIISSLSPPTVSDALFVHNFRVTQVDITDDFVSFKLGAENVLQRRFPPRKFTRVYFPSIPL